MGIAREWKLRWRGWMEGTNTLTTVALEGCLRVAGSIFLSAIAVQSGGIVIKYFFEITSWKLHKTYLPQKPSQNGFHHHPASFLNSSATKKSILQNRLFATLMRILVAVTHSLSSSSRCNRNFNCAFLSAVKVVKGNFSGENQFFSASHRAEFYGDQKARNFIVA